MNRQIQLTPSQLVYIVLGIILITGAVITVIILNRSISAEDGDDQVAAEALTPLSSPSLAVSLTTTATPEPVATDTPAATATLPPFEHVVQEGETLYFILQLYGYRTLSVVPEVLLLNGMANENDLQADTILLVPRQTPTPGAASPEIAATSSPASTGSTETAVATATLAAEVPAGGPTSDYSQCSLENQCVSADGNYWVHIVQVGETIAGLAFGYGTRVEDIQRANSLPNDIIYPSQELRIPILVTLTPTLTPTGGPDSTATPIPGFAAPTLLAPISGAEFSRGQSVILQWLSDRPLGSDERYLVIVKDRESGAEFKAVTISTVYRLPAALQPDLGEQLSYEWTVLVIRGTTISGQVISQLGGAAVFSWG